MFQYTRGERFRLFLFSFVVSVSAICSVLVAFILKTFIDIATNESELSLSFMIILTAVVLAINGIMYVFGAYLKGKIECNVENRLRQTMIKSIFDTKYIEVSQVHSSELLTKLTTDTLAVSQIFPCLIEKIFGNTVIAILTIIYLFILNAKLTLIIFVTIPVLVAIISLFNFPIARADKRMKKSEEENRILLLEQMENLKSIKIFQKKTTCIEKIKQRYAIFAKKKIVFRVWEGSALFLNGLISNAMLIISLGVGAYFVMNQQTTVGTLIAVVQLLNYIVYPFNEIGAAISNKAQAQTSMDRINEILFMEKETELVKGDQKHFSTLVLDGVDYSYGDKKVLQGFSHSFSKGRIYCIVGENGSGKSTILNLISGLLQPNNGTISLQNNGHVVLWDAREYVSFVSMGSDLFSASIVDNITFFSEQVNQKKLERFAELTNLSAYVSLLQNGYLEEIQEKGSSLSSGQVQRIVLTRALYHEKEIILLDEPTTNLDKETIVTLVDTLHRLKNDHIIIVASHDEQMISSCDEAIYL